MNIAGRRNRPAVVVVFLAAAIWPVGGGDVAIRPAGDTRVAHVIVALADNRYQGIVPVPVAIGNGDDAARNLYWGARYGLRSFLAKSESWKMVGRCGQGTGPVLERCVFQHRLSKVYVVADAYRGREIKRAVSDFFTFAAGGAAVELAVSEAVSVKAGGAADLVVSVGHDGLMEFALDRYEYARDNKHRDAIMLACASRSYFADGLRWAGQKPLLWTTALMAPEAYVVEAAVAGWARNETGQQIRRRAAQAYDRYQHCGEKAAMKLFDTGW
jgi:hypothetical protein